MTITWLFKGLVVNKRSLSGNRQQARAIIEPLENRTLYSADLLATPPDPLSDPLADYNPDFLLLPSASYNKIVELVFIDERVADLDVLIDTLQRDSRELTIHLVDTNTQGLDYVASVLSEITARAVHIISHGSTSGFQLGSSWVDAELASQQQTTLNSWRDGLTPDADLLLYGCNLAASAEGQDLSILLAGLTGADIATSTNTTGHVNFGGDWKLEHETGPIESLTIGSNSLANAWEHELLTGTNAIDLMYGDSARQADASDTALYGHGGNDLLIATKDTLSILLGTAYAGDFNVGTPNSQYGVTTNSAFVDIDSGSADFVADGDNGLNVPGGGRAIFLKDAEISTDLLILTSGKAHTITMYMTGESAGLHEMEIQIGGDTFTKSVTMPEGNALTNIHWQPVVFEYTPTTSPTPIAVKPITGQPIIAALRAVDHTFGIGNFTLEDGAGDDVVIGSPGQDTINSTTGQDYLSGGEGHDVINDGHGNDIIHGGKGNDTINDGPGNDFIYGGNGGDTITDGTGDDTISGGLGADIIIDGPGSDNIDAGQGKDIIRITVSSATDYNVFNGGASYDEIQLTNHIHSNFELANTVGNDKLVLNYDSNQGSSTYFLPDNFTFVNSNIYQLSGNGSSSYSLGDSSYTNPVQWDLSLLTMIDKKISVQGGEAPDLFSIAFTDTHYRGGDNIDIVRVYGDALDYSIDRNNFTGPVTSDDTQYITIDSNGDSDTLWDTIEYIDFNDSRYEIATGFTIDRPATIKNHGSVPAISVKEGIETFIDISSLEIRDSELQYIANDSTVYTFYFGMQDGFLRSYNYDGSIAEPIPPERVTADLTLDEINTVLDNPNRFSYQSETTNTITTDTLTIFAQDTNKTTQGGATTVLAEIPVNIIYDPILTSIESDTINYTESGPAVAISSTITLDDPNTTPIKSASIQLTNFQASEDVLNFTDTTNISSNFDSQNGVLSLTGDDTAANYQLALRSITYDNNSDNPDTTNNRTVAISVYDGQAHSNLAIRTLNIIGINNPPTLTSFNDATTDEDIELELSFADLLTLSDANDVDGLIESFVVTSNDTGVLRIGANSSQADLFEAIANDTISGTVKAYWTPTQNYNTPTDGQQIAFTMLAVDNLAASSNNAVALSVNVNDINDDPTFTVLSSDVGATDEDTEIEITLNELKNAGDATDTDGSIDAMIVKSEVSGKLRIGPSVDLAGDFLAGSNDSINSTNHAYWTPESNKHTTDNDALQAFTVIAQDNDGAKTSTHVTASVLVNDVNDTPTITSYGEFVITTNEDKKTEITLADLLSAGDENDIDGSVESVTVTAVEEDTTLWIGPDAESATLFSIGSNDTIDIDNNAYWLPDINKNGSLIAFHAAVSDDDGDMSITTPSVSVQVNAINDAPILTVFNTAVSSTNEDTTVEITLDDLTSASDATDVDNTIEAMVVQSVAVNTTLLIGTDAISAQPYVEGSNNLIDATNKAYWTPEANRNSEVDGSQSAFSVLAMDTLDSVSATPVSAEVVVRDINDMPAFSQFSSHIDSTKENTEVELTLVELLASGDQTDVDGTIEAIVVKSESTGFLKIGPNAQDATRFSTAENNIINHSLHAYWTPDENQNTATHGPQFAFSAVVRDNDGDESNTQVQAQILVQDVNHPPSLTSFDGQLGTTNEDTALQLSYERFLETGNELDNDGTVEAFVVQSVDYGELEIGGAQFDAGSNNTIDGTHSVIWTPPDNANTQTDGTRNALTVVARDDDGALSTTPVGVRIYINDINDAPTMTSFNGVAGTTTEDTRVEISFTDIADNSNASDFDGSIDAFMVQSVSSGTLHIGDSLFSETNNATIDAGHPAHWKPDADANTSADGVQRAFTIVARDNDGAFSHTAVTASVFVSDVNDAPTLTTFSNEVALTDEDTTTEITFAALIAQGNESDDNDSDGSVDAMVVTRVDSGTLWIGSTATQADHWVSGSNDKIDANNNGYWLPAPNKNTPVDGTQLAFSVVAQDDDGDRSATPVTATILIRDINDAPLIGRFQSHLATTDEDTAVQITAADLATASQATDSDGTIEEWVVQSVDSGTLYIGSSVAPQNQFAEGSNDVVKDSTPAYWVPDHNANSSLSGPLAAFTVAVRDDDGDLSVAQATTTILVQAINDLPAFTGFSEIVAITNEDFEVEVTLNDLLSAGNETDDDGTVTAMIVNHQISGTLRIGADATTATVFAAGSNDVIDEHNNAYWLPEHNRNTPIDGTQGAFAVVARDNNGGSSTNAVTTVIEVRDVNDIPVFSSFSGNVDSTDEDTEIELTFIELRNASDAVDIDGDISAFVVQSIPGGSLRIGTDAETADPFVAGSNDTITPLNHAYWTPTANYNTAINGAQFALAALALDNNNSLSAAPVAAPVAVNDVNDKPQLTVFDNYIDTTNENMEVELTFNEFTSAGDVSDIDGEVTAIIIQEVHTGTLRIGESSGNATDFSENTNNRIDASHNAYWLPAKNTSIASDVEQLALRVVVQDEDGAESTTPIDAAVLVTDINEPPVLTAVSANTSTNEDTTTEVSFADLTDMANAADRDGSVVAFIVTTVDSGTLKIGTTEYLAQHYEPGTNDTIDGIRHAYWTPVENYNTPVNGTQQAFSIVAVDNDGDASTTPIAVIAHVNDINDIPTASLFRGDIAATDEDTGVGISLSDLTRISDVTDIDGNVSAFVVQSVLSGSLHIDNQPFSVATNDIIDAETSALWTPDPHVNSAADGPQHAFTVVARDNDNDLSDTPLIASIYVNDVNDPPTLAAYKTTTLEDTTTTLGFQELLVRSNAKDIDGQVTGYRIVDNRFGEFRIGTEASTATSYAPTTNDTINASLTGYWTPFPQTNSEADKVSGQISMVAIDEDATPSQSTAILTIDISPVNDAPSATNSTIHLLEDHNHVITLQDIGYSDELDGHELLAVTITEVPSNGRLLLHNKPLDIEDTVTALQVSSNALVFSPTEHASGASDSVFKFRVQDDGGTDNGGIDTSSTPNYIGFDIQAVNDSPTLVIGNALLDEGGSLTFDRSHVESVDVDNAPAELTFTVNTLPSHGTLNINRLPLQIGDQFTQADIDNGIFSYQHDSSESRTDRFNIVVVDTGEDNARASSGLVTINIADSVNPPPIASEKLVAVKFAQPLDTNDHPEFALLHQQDGVFTVEIAIGPTQGTVLLEPDGNFVYLHNGSKVLEDKFTYRIINKDGVPSEATVHISIEPPLSAALDTSVISSNPLQNQPEQKVTSGHTAISNTIVGTKFVSGDSASDLSAERSNESTVKSSSGETSKNFSQLLSDADVGNSKYKFHEVIQHRQLKEQKAMPIKENASLLLDTNLDNADLSILFETHYEDKVSRHSTMTQSLNEQRDQLENNSLSNFELGSRAVSVSSGLSIGYLLWLTRGGVLLGSVMTSLPAWRTLDPLPVLDNLNHEDDSDSESLETMVEDTEDSQTTTAPDKPIENKLLKKPY